jgi:hypothetical protein
MPELFPRCHAIWLNHHYVQLLHSPSGEAFFAAWMSQPHVDELWMKMDINDVAAFQRSDIQSAITHKWANLKTLHLDRKNRHEARNQSWALPWIRSKWATLNSLLAHATSLCDLRITVLIGWAGVVVASTLPTLTTLDLSMVVELPHGECRLQAGAFPCLSSLCLEDPTPDARLALGILAVCSATLTDCRLELCEVTETRRIQEVMRSVSQHGQLRKAIVAFAFAHVEHDWELIFDAMLPMAHLTHLTIHMVFEVTERHLTQILQLCPRLQEWDGPVTPCALSLPAIMAILAPRPSLSYIPLDVDVSQGLPSAANIASFGTHAFVGPVQLKNFDTESRKWAEETLKRLFPMVSLA